MPSDTPHLSPLEQEAFDKQMTEAQSYAGKTELEGNSDE